MNINKLAAFLFWVILIFSFTNGQSQEKVFQTFKDTRVINGQSIETLKAGRLDFRVGHKFGDIAGDGGGWQSFYGLENSSDVSIGFDYGVTDNFMIGIMRTKGSGPLRQNLHGMMKIKLISQEVEGNTPFSLAIFGMASYSTMPRSSNELSISYFAKPEHRQSYHLEVLLGSKLSNRFSYQLSGAWTYRNIVTSQDQNDLASISGALKYQMSKSFGLIIESRIAFSSLRTAENGYYPGIGVGFEWETGGGHVFQMNFTNTTGIAETDYVPYTRSNWQDGEFRLGFTISRLFRL